MDSRTHRHAPSNPFADDGSALGAKDPPNFGRSHPTASDAIGSTFDVHSARSRTRKSRPRGCYVQQDVTAHNGDVYIPRNLTSVVPAIGFWRLGTAQNRARFDANPKLESQCLRIDAGGSARFDRRPARENSVATSVERLGCCKTLEPFSRTRELISSDVNGLSVSRQASTFEFFWFHPLAWWIDRELARLAEEACDDVAVSKTKDKEEYAATLVDIARTAAANGGVLSWPVISMATDSNLARRVDRILTRSFQVPKPFGRSAWVTLFVSSVPVIYLSAAVSLAPARRDWIALKDALPNPPR